VGGVAPAAGGLEMGEDAQAEGAEGGGVEGGVGGVFFPFAAGGGGEAGGVESAEAEEAGAGGFVPGGGELFKEGAEAGEEGDFEPAGLFLAQAAEVEGPEDLALGGKGAGGADEAGGEELPDEEGDGAGPDGGVEDGEVEAREMGGGPGAGGGGLVEGSQGAIDEEMEIVVGEGGGEALVGEVGGDGGGDGFGDGGIQGGGVDQVLQVGAEDFADIVAGGNRDHGEGCRLKAAGCRGRGQFSMVWKKVFHGMEKTGLDFPWHGKNPEPFSTLWKTFFHTMEKVGVASARAGGLIGGR
jgi:hypothetical protein